VDLILLADAAQKYRLAVPPVGDEESQAALELGPPLDPYLDQMWEWFDRMKADCDDLATAV
jgi:hypothetical protein